MDTEDMQSEALLHSKGDVIPLNLDRKDDKRRSTSSSRVSTNFPEKVTFDRRELSEILRVYGHHVADGEWRDYAIDFQKDRAVFSIFKRTSEMPVYRVVKNPKLARKQGAYAVVNTSGMILKRGHELKQVLKVLDARKHLRVVD